MYWTINTEFKLTLVFKYKIIIFKASHTIYPELSKNKPTHLYGNEVEYVQSNYLLDYYLIAPLIFQLSNWKILLQNIYLSRIPDRSGCIHLLVSSNIKNIKKQWTKDFDQASVDTWIFWIQMLLSNILLGMCQGGASSFKEVVRSSLSYIWF